MSVRLDREGIFKARPVGWRVKKFDSSQAVAIAIEFAILAQLDGNEWTSWDGYEAVHAWGDWFVIKKDGRPNVGSSDKPGAIEQLRDSIGWDGRFETIAASPPPDVVVQITVKSEQYNGSTYFKATWMNPGDYTPTPGGATTDEVKALDARFGSLLRAAAGGGTKKAPAKAPAPAARKAAPAEPFNPATVDPDQIPF